MASGSAQTYKLTHRDGQYTSPAGLAPGKKLTPYKKLPGAVFQMKPEVKRRNWDKRRKKTLLATLTQRRKKRHRTFDIFITAGGNARYVETVGNLAAARKRLKQLAHNASGDCFLYSLEDGIVELIIRPELPKRLQKAAKTSHC